MIFKFRVRTVVSALLAATFAFGTTSFATSASANSEFKFDRSWTYAARNNQQWQMLQGLVNKKAPELKVQNWIGDKASLADLKGKIVLIDFWATWCGPCKAAVPHTNEIMDRYKDKGVVVLAVCDSGRGGERMSEVVKQTKMRYPTALDVDSQTTRAFGVQWFPFYVLIDGEGMIRAAGLKPSHIEVAIDALLQADKSGGSTNSNQSGAGTESGDSAGAHLLEGDAKTRARLNGIQGKQPPALEVTEWINSEALDVNALKGKVVLVDFWATWCGPCKASVPHTNALQESYKDQGLVIIGVCATNGAEKMRQTVESLGIKYPVCADVNNLTVNAYSANGFPDYYLIDRAGVLRYADVRNASVEEAVGALIAEPAPR